MKVIKLLFLCILTFSLGFELTYLTLDYFAYEKLKNDPKEHYYKTFDGLCIRQCGIVLYGIDYSFPDDIKDEIILGVEFWNIKSGKQIFKYIGEVGDLANDPVDNGIGLMVIYPSFTENEENERVLGTASFDLITYGGCIFLSSVVLYPRLLSSSNIAITNVVRHEVGHILGLKHNPKEGSLMYETIDLGLQNLIDLSEVEYRALKEFY